MNIGVPGYRTLIIENVVMDFNGTIAVDGHMKDSVKERIMRLSGQYQVYVITSDTQGTAAKELDGLPVTLKIFDNANAGECKRQIVEELGGDRCACVGNGNNDRFMFRKAALSIAVLETEGLYAPILSDADLLVKSSEDALDLLLDTKRLISGLRG
jgi:P-type E1-E2 ATPase